MPLNIAVIANKNWECDPLVGALLAVDARPATLTAFERGYDPVEGSGGTPPDVAEGLPVHAKWPVRPRLRLAGPGFQAEVWCIQDWSRKKRRLAPGDLEAKWVDRTSSSSHEKLTFALPRIREAAFGGKPPDLVIAFGTAGIPNPDTLNGCVTIGSRIYINDAWRGDPDGIAKQEERFGPLIRDEIAASQLEEPIESKHISRKLFQDITYDVRYAAEARFVAPPIGPASPLRILAGHGYAALSTINIADYDDYVWADHETLEKFAASVAQREIGSMETTHGLIRLAFRDTPFLFVSGLTDRVPMFNAEVTPRKYTQNFTAAHNAGVAVAHLLPELGRLHAAGKLLV